MKTILKKPIITEKSIDRTRDRFYTFEVDQSATKNQVKNAVESLFSVTVTSVQMLNRKGKERRVGRMRAATYSAERRFGIVKLAPNQTIGVFDITPEQTK